MIKDPFPQLWGPGKHVALVTEIVRPDAGVPETTCLGWIGPWDEDEELREFTALEGDYRVVLSPGLSELADGRIVYDGTDRWSTVHVVEIYETLEIANKVKEVA